MPRYRNALWWFLWALVSLIRPLLCRFKIEGREHVPEQQGAIVASNHNLGPDFIFLAIASPRELCFMAKAEVFTWHPLLSRLLRSAGVFPVRRGQGDSVAIETAVELARRHYLIAMFPEGTRSKSGVLMRGKTGAARIALAAGVPIVPAVVINSRQVLRRRSWRRPVVTVRFGKPIVWDAALSELDDDGESARAFTDAVMIEIATMLPEELRGEYGEAVKQGVR